MALVFASDHVLSFERENSGGLESGGVGGGDSHWHGSVRPGLHMGRRRGPTHELQANQLFSQTGQAEQNKGEMKRREAEACNERRGRASVSPVGKEMTALLFQ